MAGRVRRRLRHRHHFDAISSEGDYVGGAIAPGPRIAAEALFQRTAKLQRIELARPPRAIGSNTVHGMQSGVFLGYASLVEGMVSRFRAELGPDMRTIATGGLAGPFAAETSAIDVVDTWLTWMAAHDLGDEQRVGR